MRKSKLLLLIPIFASFFNSLTSCNNNNSNSTTYKALDKGDKIVLSKSEGIDSFVLIETENQLNEIARYDQACIIVSREGCQYCDSLLYSLRGNKDSDGKYTNGYIYRTSQVFYLVDPYVYTTCYSADYNKTGSFALLYPEVKGTPTMLFYNDGKLVNTRVGHFYSTTPDKVDRSDDEKNYEKTKSILSKYIMDNEYYSLNTLTRIENNLSAYVVYYIESRDEDDDTLGFDTTTLDSKISESNNITIIYTWRRCNDCKEFKETVLEPYLYNNSKKAYYYEVDGYFLKKRNSDATKSDYGQKLWYDFSNKYFLNDIPGFTNDYGSTGATPAIINYKNKNESHTTKTFRNDTDLNIDSNSKLYYATSIYDEVKSTLRSDTSVTNVDTADSNYQKALKELETKRDNLEKDLLTEFLKTVL